VPLRSSCAAAPTRAAGPLRERPRGSDRLRVILFLAGLALIALHPAARHALASLAGDGPPWPRECRLQEHGTIYCLDETGRDYRAR
jgi:hypothetical protein